MGFDAAWVFMAAVEFWERDATVGGGDFFREGLGTLRYRALPSLAQDFPDDLNYLFSQ